MLPSSLPARGATTTSRGSHAGLGSAGAQAAARPAHGSARLAARHAAPGPGLHSPASFVGPARPRFGASTGGARTEPQQTHARLQSKAAHLHLQQISSEHEGAFRLFHCAIPSKQLQRRQRRCTGAQASTVDAAQGPATSAGAAELYTRGPVVFIVNPKGGNGAALLQWNAMKDQVMGALPQGATVREALTSYPLHAVQLAEQAVAEGASVVVAVGGDGTLHEVVNGLCRASMASTSTQSQWSRDAPRMPGATPAQHRPALGVIPLGTGCDFARTFGWKSNCTESSALRLSRGQLQVVDVGRVALPLTGEERFFINIASLHLSASVGMAAAQFKALGPLCYAVAVLTEFPKHRNADLHIRVDGGQWETLPAVTAVAIGNGQFFGGGMNITPDAHPSSGSFQMVALSGFQLADFLMHGTKLFAGTHLAVPGVSSRRVHSLDIEDPQARPGGDNVPALLSPIRVEVDGEYLGTLPATLEIIREALDVIV